jgi:hypothetical protein
MARCLLRSTPGAVNRGRSIAFARYLFQTLPIKDGKGASIVLDYFPLLNRRRQAGDRRASDTQHTGERPLRRMELSRVGSVLHHQEPARQTCFNLMGSRAGSVLRHLLQSQESVFTKFAPQWRAGVCHALKGLCLDAPGLPRPLHQDPQWFGFDSKEQRQTDHSLIAHVPGRDPRPLWRPAKQGSPWENTRRE